MAGFAYLSTKREKIATHSHASATTFFGQKALKSGKKRNLCDCTKTNNTKSEAHVEAFRTIVAERL